MAFITGRSSINLRDLKCKRPRMSNLTKEDTMSKETGASQSSNLVEKARQARLEEKERKRSEPKVEPHFFPANSPAHSSLAGEEKSIFHKFRRLPSIVRKFSVTSNTNGQANIEHNEEKLSKQPENRPEDALAEEKSINTIIAESDQENEEKYAEEDSVQVNLIKKDREDDSETRL
eukprot:gene15354-6586_t